MKKLYLILLSALIMTCTTVRKMDTLSSVNMKNVFEKEFSQEQFDSICLADTIPNSFNKWLKGSYVDFENGNKIVEYLYIKSLGNNQNVYRVEKRGDLYKITKRITK